jgi:hypothetical protein
MDSYNSDKSAFVFLLSTRAGGLGLPPSLLFLPSPHGRGETAR